MIRRIERGNGAEFFASIPSTKDKVSWSAVSLKAPSYPQRSAGIAAGVVRQSPKRLVFEGLHQQHKSFLNSKTILLSHRFQFLFFIPLCTNFFRI